MGETAEAIETADLAPDDIERVRAAVKALQERESITGPRAAELSGVPYGTLSTWLTGKYAGNNARIAAQMQRWLDSWNSQRRTRAVLPRAPDFVATPSAEAFLASLELAQAAQVIAVISGGAGVGKTTAVREYQRSAPNVWLVTARPSIATMRPFQEEVMCALGISERIARRRAAACISRMRDTGGLLIVDEAQHLAVETLDELRSIHDAASIGIALVGNETVYSRLEGQGRTPQFAQLFSRVGRRTRRANPLKADIEALVNAWGVVEPAQRRLLRVIGGKPGGLRNIRMTMMQAHLLALGDGAEGVITEDRLARAYARISDTPVETLASREDA